MPEELAVLTQRLAAQLGVVPHVTWQNQNVATRSRYTFGLDASEKLYVLATLFVPFGALFTALTQRRGSLVRFVALQELTRFFATLAIVVLGAAGSAILIRPEAGPGARSALVREPALVVLLCLLSLLVVGSVLGAVVAVVRAFDGEAWIIPGLGPLVRRFVPESRPLAAAGAGLLLVAPTGVSGGLERATTPWPKTTISQTVATTLTMLGVTFLALMTCGIGTYDWFSLPNYPVPPSKFRSAQLREIAQLVELQPGEELAYVGVWGFFDLAAGMSVLTSRRVLVYDPETSPKLQSIELFLIESVRLQPSSEWTEPSRLIVSGAGRKLELPLWDSERGDRKFFDALEKARTRAKPR